MKTTLVALALAALTTTAAAGCASPTGDDGVEASQGAATVSLKADVKAITVDKEVPATDLSPSGEQNVCSLKATYLEVSGLKPSVNKKLNDALRPEEVNQLVEAGCDTGYELDTETTVLFNDAGVLSVQTNGNSYYAGAAHPNNLLSTTSYNLETGENIGVGDVFADASGKQFADIVLAKMTNGTQNQKDFVEAYGDAVTANPEWLSFALTKEGVTLYLTNYVGGADFVLGADPVDFTYGELREALSSKSALKQIWSTNRN